MEGDFYQFFWEGTDNPNDPSGVAQFKVGMQSVSVPMHSLPEALKLSRLIEKACDRSRQKAIDRAADGILRLLTEQRYN